MSAIILGWNPDRRTQWNYPAAVDRVAATGLHVERWDVGRHRSIPEGTEAWLLLQSRHGRGLIGHGVVVSEQAEPPVPGSATVDVTVAFDVLLPLGEQIAVDVLQSAAPGVPWNGLRGSGRALDRAAEAQIRALWREFGPAPGPDPTRPVSGTYPAGALIRVQANRYEQDPDARRACIAHHGTNCAACGFSFELTYGGLGRDFIDVHHLVPVSRLGSGYELDPITDLVPLCPNCHAMAHLGVDTPRTVAELRRIIAGAGFLAGSTVSPGELQAQQEAQRILEQH
jgi:5-methylcytosine-specific restriction protein A